MAYVLLQLKLPLSPYKSVRFKLDHPSSLSERTYFMDDPQMVEKQKQWGNNVGFFTRLFRN